MVSATPNPRYRGFGKATTVERARRDEPANGSVVSIEPAIALVDHDFTSPRVAPADSVVVPSIDVVDDYRSITFTPPMLRMAMTEPLDQHNPRDMTLHNHSPGRTTVAGVFVAHRNSSGNRAAAEHDLAGNILSMKWSCRQRHDCNQRPRESAGLHKGLGWGRGIRQPHQMPGPCQ
jgi:hypothetical protein